MVLKPSTGKRPALSSSKDGPVPKKVRLEKHITASKRVEKRSRPVTAPLSVVESESEGEEGSSEDEWRDEDQASGRDDDLLHEEEDTMNDGEPAISNSTIENPNAARESHKAQKLLTDKRKASKPHSTLLTEAKRSWSLVRQKSHKITQEERQKHVEDLMNAIRGHVKDIVFKHDASRIVQSVVKYGGQKERDEIAAELKGRYKDLAQNKYSKFLVTKLIRLCPAHRASILLEFQNHVLRLLLHREATSVLADAFELHANAYERTILLRDFYGREAILFNMTSGSDADKELARKGLKGFLEGVDGERRKRVLKSVKENLVAIFNNPDKGAVTHAIVHRVLWEYLTVLRNISEEAEREKLQREIFETCQDTLAEMVHTKDGSRAVREFLALGTAKDRKQILKVLKPHVERMCLDDEAQLVLFTALDVIDDTKLVFKSIIAEMTSAAPKLFGSPQGRRSLIYLLVPRTRRHFTPAQIVVAAETDEIRSRTSKKNAEVRESEVRQFASEPLISWVEQNAESIIREAGASLVVTEIMLFAEGDKTAAIRSLLRAVSSSYPSTDEAAGLHPIDLPHTSRMYKALLQGGHFNHVTKRVERVAGWDAAAFAAEFVSVVGEATTVAMCTQGEGNGAFVVAELCEALVHGEKEKERAVMKGWFGSEQRAGVESGQAKGKKVLLQKLDAL